jgi:co-chaperonin GroES (HSP10)
MAIKPILHRVVVRQDKLEDTDAAFAAARRMGLQLADAERRREQGAVDTGTVLAVGPTAFKDFGMDQSPIKVGDTIVYAKYGGKNVVDPDDGETYVILNDEDCISIVTKEKEPVDG